ncbi:YozQ family protein [Niallia sp. JL1B1071]
MFTLKKKNADQNTEVAGRVFDPSDYEKKNQLSSGLATTHEQATDTYTEGEIGAVIDDVDGEDIQIGKKTKK